MDLVKASDGTHKWTAIFKDGTRVSFGAAGYRDYTQHHDKLRRANYLSRHRSRESWSNPKTAGSLSRHLLWGDSTSLERNLAEFKRKFSLG